MEIYEKNTELIIFSLKFLDCFSNVLWLGTQGIDPNNRHTGGAGGHRGAGGAGGPGGGRRQNLARRPPMPTIPQVSGQQSASSQTTSASSQSTTRTGQVSLNNNGSQASAGRKEYFSKIDAIFPKIFAITNSKFSSKKPGR